jgi:hypothetical protein
VAQAFLRERGPVLDSVGLGESRRHFAQVARARLAKLFPRGTTVAAASTSAAMPASAQP